LLFVRKEGPMAALGHNHIMSVRELSGSVQWQADPARGRLELQFPVAGILVDEPERRAAAGDDYRSVVNDATRAGTRDNMLGARLLQAEQYPRISLRSQQLIATGPESLRALLEVQVRGRATTVEVPLRWQLAGELLSANGTFMLRQTALGLEPFSVALGALRVADEIEVRFNIVARRVRV
jgi:polyisoprenoid-binding protein YceI